MLKVGEDAYKKMCLARDTDSVIMIHDAHLNDSVKAIPHSSDHLQLYEKVIHPLKKICI